MKFSITARTTKLWNKIKKQFENMLFRDLFSNKTTKNIYDFNSSRFLFFALFATI